jgi:uncharacterized protein (DUF58 family)
MPTIEQTPGLARAAARKGELHPVEPRLAAPQSPVRSSRHSLIPSLRLIRIVAVSAPLWLLAVVVPGGWLAAVGFLLLLVALCARDVGSAPRAGQLRAFRQLPRRFSHGEECSVELILVNDSPSRVRVFVRDEVPDALELLTPLAPVEVPVQGWATCAYTVRAVRRGAHEFGDVVVRVQHGPGLLLKQMTLLTPDRIQIYPRFRGVDDYDLLARIDQRDEIVRRPRRVQGAGTDFESLRPYLPGEDLRNIDWKATARRAALISRQRQVERGQQVALMIDAGRLMAEQIVGFTKLDHAMNAAIMLSHVAQKRGDAIAVACFSNRIESFLPPVRGPVIVPRVLEALYAVEARPVESDYWQVVAEMMSKLTRRSLVIMLTEVLDAASSTGLINNLRRAASRHLVLCVVLTEPRLHALANRVPASLPETFSKAAACDLLRRRRLALERMRAGGILVLETEPARLSVQLVRRYLEIRQADLQ